jgi:ABC-2 type transport system permease protein
MHLGSLFLVLPLVLLTFVGLGLVSAAGTMITRRTNPLGVVLGSASIFLSGVFYPVTVLPVWLQSAGQLLPLTHALNALRMALLAGAPPSDLASSLGLLAAFAGILGPAGVGLFAYALRRARVDGSLAHY